MSDNRKPIPHRLYNPSSDHPYVAGAADIFDDELEKSQAEINAELYAVIETLPVSDGTDIDPGKAYIDSTDRTVKVKATE